VGRRSHLVRHLKIRPRCGTVPPIAVCCALVLAPVESNGAVKAHEQPSQPSILVPYPEKCRRLESPTCGVSSVHIAVSVRVAFDLTFEPLPVTTKQTVVVNIDSAARGKGHGRGCLIDQKRPVLLDESHDNEHITFIDIEALCAAPPEALAHSPSQNGAAQLRPHLSASCTKTAAAAAVVAWRGGRAPPGPRRPGPAPRPVVHPPPSPAPRPSRAVSPKGRRGGGLGPGRRAPVVVVVAAAAVAAVVVRRRPFWDFKFKKSNCYFRRFTHARTQRSWAIGNYPPMYAHMPLPLPVRALPPDPRLKPGPVFVASGGAKKLHCPLSLLP